MKKFLFLTIFFILTSAFSVVTNPLVYCGGTGASGSCPSVYRALMTINSIDDNVITYSTTVEDLVATAYSKRIWVLYEDENGDTYSEVMATLTEGSGTTHTDDATFDLDTLTYDFQKLIGVRAECICNSESANSTADVYYEENDGTYDVAVISATDEMKGISVFSGSWVTEVGHSEVNLPYPVDFTFFDDSSVAFTDVPDTTYQLRVILDADAGNLSELQDIVNASTSRKNLINFNSSIPDDLEIYTTANSDPATTQIDVIANYEHIMDNINDGDQIGLVTHADVFNYDTAGSTSTILVKNTTTSDYDARILGASSDDNNDIVMVQFKESGDADYNNILLTIEDAIMWGETFDILFDNILFWGEGDYAELTNIDDNSPLEASTGSVQIEADYVDDDTIDITGATCTVQKTWLGGDDSMTYTGGRYVYTEANSLSDGTYSYVIKCQKTGYRTVFSSARSFVIGTGEEGISGTGTQRDLLWSTFISSENPDTSFGSLSTNLVSNDIYSGSGEDIILLKLNTTGYDISETSYFYMHNTILGVSTCSLYQACNVTDENNDALETITWNQFDGTSGLGTCSVTGQSKTTDEDGWYTFSVENSILNSTEDYTVIALRCLNSNQQTTFISEEGNSTYCSSYGCVYTQDLTPQFYLDGRDSSAPQITAINNNPSGSTFSINTAVEFSVTGYDNIAITKVYFESNFTGSSANVTIFNEDGSVSPYGIGTHSFAYDKVLNSSGDFSYKWWIFDEAGNYILSNEQEISVVDPTTETSVIFYFNRQIGATGDANTDIVDNDIYIVGKYRDYEGDMVIGATCTAYFNGTTVSMPYYPSLNAYGTIENGYIGNFGDNSLSAGYYYPINVTCTKTGLDSATSGYNRFYTLLTEAPDEIGTSTNVTNNKIRLEESLDLYAYYYSDDSDEEFPKLDISGGECNFTLNGLVYNNMTWDSSRTSWVYEDLTGATIGEGYKTYNVTCNDTTYGWKSILGTLRVNTKSDAFLPVNIYYNPDTFTNNNLDFCIIYVDRDDLESGLPYQGIQYATCTASYSTYADWILLEKRIDLFGDSSIYVDSLYSDLFLDDVVNDTAYCGTISDMDLNDTDTVDFSVTCTSSLYETKTTPYTISFGTEDSVTVTLLEPVEGYTSNTPYIDFTYSLSGCEEKCSSERCRVKIGYDQNYREYDDKTDGTYGINMYVENGDHIAFAYAECDSNFQSIFDDIDINRFSVFSGSLSGNFELATSDELSSYGNPIPITIIAQESGQCYAKRTDVRAYLTDSRAGLDYWQGYSTYEVWKDEIPQSERSAFLEEISNYPTTDEIIFNLDSKTLTSWATDDNTYNYTLKNGVVIRDKTRSQILNFLNGEDWHDTFESKVWAKPLRSVYVSSSGNGRNNIRLSHDEVLGDVLTSVTTGNHEMVKSAYDIISKAIIEGDVDAVTEKDFRLTGESIMINATVEIICEELDGTDYFQDEIHVTRYVWRAGLIDNLGYNLLTARNILIFMLFITPLVSIFFTAYFGRRK